MVPVCKPGQSGPCLFSSHSVCLSLVCQGFFWGDGTTPRLLHRIVVHQLGVPVSFLEVTSKNRKERTAASPKCTPARMTAHKSREPGAYCIACRQLSKLESILSRWPSGSKPLPVSALSHLCSFSCLRVTLSSLYCLLLGGGA